MNGDSGTHAAACSTLSLSLFLSFFISLSPPPPLLLSDTHTCGSVLAKMGLMHVRGVLLYGAPGCGKTLIARKIGKMLVDKEPKALCCTT